MTLPDLTALVRGADPSDLPDLVGALAEAQALVLARIVASANGQRHEPAGPGLLLTPQEAAGIARVPVKWLFRHTKGLRFRRNLSRKRILFEESGLRKWLEARNS